MKSLQSRSLAGRDDNQLHGYDLMVRQLIPGYASLARLSVALLAASPLASEQGARVLVAGCGTGAELVEARRQRPDWILTALDPASDMLIEAQRRMPLAAPSAGISPPLRSCRSQNPSPVPSPCWCCNHCPMTAANSPISVPWHVSWLQAVSWC